MPASRTLCHRRLAAPLLALAVTLAATGCGADPDPVGPSGVDTLQVPTPSPDPADFVETVDNRWLPWRAGARWEYRVSGPDGVGSRVVSVLEPTEVAGVPATPVRTVSKTPDGASETTTHWYAQDRDGHVWLLGEEGRWQLGEETDAAGLAVPASPRLGDGYRAAEVAGTSELVVRVRQVQGTLTVPAGSYEDTVTLRVDEQVLGGSGEHDVVLAPDVGPVLVVSGDGEIRTELVTFVPGG